MPRNAGRGSAEPARAVSIRIINGGRALKNHVRISLCLLLGLLGFISLPAFASQDIFLCPSGANPVWTGESADPDHPGCIDVQSWSWGMSQAGTTTPRVSANDVTIVKSMDRSTPDFMYFVAKGQYLVRLILLAEAVCPLQGCTPYVYFTLTMDDVQITSVEPGGSRADDRLTESISFKFSKAEWCYTAQPANGNPGLKRCNGWDFLQNKAY